MIVSVACDSKTTFEIYLSISFAIWSSWSLVGWWMQKWTSKCYYPHNHTLIAHNQIHQFLLFVEQNPVFLRPSSHYGLFYTLRVDWILNEQLNIGWVPLFVSISIQIRMFRLIAKGKCAVFYSSNHIIRIISLFFLFKSTNQKIKLKGN